MICLSQLFPIFLWKDFFNSSHVFCGNGMNFLYPLGFFLDCFPTFSHLFGGWILSRLQNYKKYAKVISSKLRKNNHYGLILNQQAMTVMALLTKYS